MSEVGVVAIGRNEGERLRRCLDSLIGRGLALVYVDSGSTDDSVAMARSKGVEVVELDMSRPFTAARARNAGFERLSQVDPGVRFVQVLDGDCEVADGWLDRARRELDDNPTVAVVCGRRREKFPEHSIYNRMADVEWAMPIRWQAADGPAEACGGDAMIRAAAYREVGGFDPSLPAGEEPEFCQRLHAAGWRVVRLGDDMTWHDLDMRRFRQWARRQFRTGYGALDTVTRFGRGPTGPFRKVIRSARIWAVGWPLVVILGGVLAAALGGTAVGLAIAGVLALALPVQMARVARRVRPLADGPVSALAYGVLTMLGMWPQVAGQLLYLRDRSVGRHARLIEYKFAAPATEGAAPAP
jgi:GT2 family glycosyltransferase